MPIHDQEAFFNSKAASSGPEFDKSSVFYKYATREIVTGFLWLGDCETILDYGCGVGGSLDLFVSLSKHRKHRIVGVDIAREAVRSVQKRYPEHHFYIIKDNKLAETEDNSIDGCYLLHVLHHSTDHAAIFREICRKMKTGGKVFISDLSSGNLLVRFGRALFTFLPSSVRNRFSDDLVVDGEIPFKHKVDMSLVIEQLEQTGFAIVRTMHGQLFAFVFAWLDKLLHCGRFPFFGEFFAFIVWLETFLLRFRVFHGQAEVFSIQCVKK